MAADFRGQCKRPFFHLCRVVSDFSLRLMKSLIGGIPRVKSGLLMFTLRNAWPLRGGDYNFYYLHGFDFFLFFYSLGFRAGVLGVTHV